MVTFGFCVPRPLRSDLLLGEMNGLRVRTVSTSLGEWISSGNEWSQSPCHPVSGSTCPGLAIGAWCGKGTAPGCAWCLRGAMLLRGFRLFGVALHREPKGTKRTRYSAAAIDPHFTSRAPLHQLEYALRLKQ